MMEKDKKLKRHENRDDLAGEYAWGDMGQIILLMIFLAVWISDSFFLKYSTFLSAYIPYYFQIPLVLIIMFCSGYLARSGLRIVFGETREQPVVIRKGVFGMVRHPIYLGSILFYLGMIIATLSLLSLLMWIVIIIFYHLISRYEEKLLLKKFGIEYENYLREVPMWIPGQIFRERIS
jgi:protein-S-isoprenylcysteine O-methyltransferase Ste14